ncbi:MAG: hypothetical protein ACK5UR_05135 [Armatimonadota bacterium]|jgi:hypothetical protein|nr:hypothetical protein [Fimbriimonadaceae bacterium]
MAKVLAGFLAIVLSGATPNQQPRSKAKAKSTTKFNICHNAIKSQLKARWQNK